MLQLVREAATGEEKTALLLLANEHPELCDGLLEDEVVDVLRAKAAKSRYFCSDSQSFSSVTLILNFPILNFA